MQGEIADAAPLLPAEMMTPADDPPPVRHGTLLLAGFWARGNAGDEAMAQCVVETMGPAFDYAFSVDELGAYPKYWDWYPYAGRIIVNQNNIGGLKRLPKVRGLLVGGGGLPLGFMAGTQMFARSIGLRAAIAGIDIWPTTGKAGRPPAQEAARYLAGFDLAYVRTPEAIETARSGGFAEGLRLGADWALNLKADQNPDVFDQRHRALVVVREDDPAIIPANFRDQLRRLLAALSAAGLVPVLLPYSPEDERMLDALDLLSLAPVERSWWNARRLKQLSACSGLTVSVGRLHPMIFAAPTGRPVMAIGRLTHKPGKPADAKLRTMAADLGIDLHRTIDEAVRAIEAGRILPADAAKVAAATARLDHQAATLRRFFAEEAA